MVNEESQTPTYTTGASKQTATPDKQIGKHAHDRSPHYPTFKPQWFMHMHNNYCGVVKGGPWANHCKY